MESITVTHATPMAEAQHRMITLVEKMTGNKMSLQDKKELCEIMDLIVADVEFHMA